MNEKALQIILSLALVVLIIQTANTYFPAAASSESDKSGAGKVSVFVPPEPIIKPPETGMVIVTVAGGEA